MSYRVYSTVSKEGSNETYAKFLKVFNMVFPLEVENKYVELTNLVISYYQVVRELEMLKSNVPRELNKVNNDAELYLSQLKEAVSSLTSESPSYIYDNIESLVSLVRRTIQRKESTNKSHPDLEQNYENVNATSDSIRNDLFNIISSLRQKLDDLKQLDLTENKRLSGLVVTERHLSIINEFNITDEEKKVLSRMLQSYLNLRVSAFNIIENVAEQMVALYKKREVLDQNSVEYENGLSAFMALYNIQIGDAIMLNVVSPLLCDSLNVKCSIMDVIAGFFNTGAIDSKLVEEVELGSQLVDYSFRESYMNIINRANAMNLGDQGQKR